MKKKKNFSNKAPSKHTQFDLVNVDNLWKHFIHAFQSISEKKNQSVSISLNPKKRYHGSMSFNESNEMKTHDNHKIPIPIC